MIKALELIRICESAILPQKSIVRYTYNPNFSQVEQETIKKFFKQHVTSEELNNFLDICDNRIEHYQKEKKDTSTIMGFCFVALPIGIRMFTDLTNVYLVILALSVLAIIVGALISAGYAWLVNRKLIYFWTVFREKALLLRPR